MSPSSSSAKRSNCKVSATGKSSSIFHLQAVGERRQIGAALIGFGGDFLDHAGDRIGRNARQSHAEAETGERALAAGRHRRRPLGHERVDLVHQLAELGIEPVARMLQLDLNFGGDPAGIAATAR